MKEMARYGLILSVICALAGASLAGMNALTRGKIAAQAKSEEEDSLKAVLPDAVRFDPVKSADTVVYYKSFNKDGQPCGIAFKVSAKGYSSDIETMVGLAPSGEINAIKILSQSETPGLGANITEPDFTGQFKGRRAESLEGVQAITGATISSSAVINAVKKKAAELKEIVK
jgi:electron transport complex protein RnfG